MKRVISVMARCGRKGKKAQYKTLRNLHFYQVFQDSTTQGSLKRWFLCKKHKLMPPIHWKASLPFSTAIWMSRSKAKRWKPSRKLILPTTPKLTWRLLTKRLKMPRLTWLQPMPIF
ncbi:hypothetical protein LG290_11965 [Halomonas sediminis]